MAQLNTQSTIPFPSRPLSTSSISSVGARPVMAQHNTQSTIPFPSRRLSISSISSMGSRPVMAQHNTQSTIPPPSRRLFTSPISSVGSRSAQILEAPAALVEFSNPTTPHRPNATKVDKRVEESTPLMFEVKPKQSSGNTSMSSVSEIEQPMYAAPRREVRRPLLELDPGRQMLERAGRPAVNPQGLQHVRLIVCWFHIFCYAAFHATQQDVVDTARNPQNAMHLAAPGARRRGIHAEVQRPRPNPLRRNPDRLSLSLVAALIVAVVFPVLMLLNPNAPIWKESGACMARRGKVILASVFAPKRQVISSATAPPQPRPIAPGTRHSTV
ncbi:hypothetical protein JB92DRAFT_2894315 [Gautieria morchelliformis]|nr:hypothetical protein JB92DRAFT_2894315 [Gautieria morchelliformis]